MPAQKEGTLRKRQQRAAQWPPQFQSPGQQSGTPVPWGLCTQRLAEVREAHFGSLLPALS